MAVARPVRTVLVTGGAGFVGAVLCRQLLEHGYRVRVVDLGVFGTDHLPPEVELVHGDILNWENTWLSEVDAVINLAGLSNDPMADYSPALNMQINGAAAALAALMCKRAGIRRFIQGSSCSVYGRVDGEVDETWQPAPQYPYGLAKLMADVAILALADDSFRPVIIRKGTVCGWSPRMRFDLIVNAMVKSGILEGRIVVHDPDVWRPLLDVRDAAAAYMAALEAPLAAAGIYNVAAGNYTTMQVAQAVRRRLFAAGYSAEIVVTGDRDPRSYRVSTWRARSELNFTPSISLDRMVDDLIARLHETGLESLEDPRSINISWWQHWVEHHQRVGMQGMASC